MHPCGPWGVGGTQPGTLCSPGRVGAEVRTLRRAPRPACSTCAGTGSTRDRSPRQGARLQLTSSRTSTIWRMRCAWPRMPAAPRQRLSARSRSRATRAQGQGSRLNVAPMIPHPVWRRRAVQWLPDFCGRPARAGPTVTGAAARTHQGRATPHGRQRWSSAMAVEPEVHSAQLAGKAPPCQGRQGSSSSSSAASPPPPPPLLRMAAQLGRPGCPAPPIDHVTRYRCCSWLRLHCDDLHNPTQRQKPRHCCSAEDLL